MGTISSLEGYVQFKDKGLLRYQKEWMLCLGRLTQKREPWMVYNPYTKAIWASSKVRTSWHKENYKLSKSSLVNLLIQMKGKSKHTHTHIKNMFVVVYVSNGFEVSKKQSDR